ncbi:unnamed protein product, partial [Ectocarpus sp. 6 AP-2014]
DTPPGARDRRGLPAPDEVGGGGGGGGAHAEEEKEEPRAPDAGACRVRGGRRGQGLAQQRALADPGRPHHSRSVSALLRTCTRWQTEAAWMTSLSSTVLGLPPPPGVDRG